MPERKSPKKQTPLTVENFPEVFDRVTAYFYNGSETPTEKPLRQGLTDMSHNVFTMGKSISSIDARLKKTEDSAEESAELLEDKKARKQAAASLMSLAKNSSIKTKLTICGIGIVVIHWVIIQAQAMGADKAWAWITQHTFGV